MSKTNNKGLNKKVTTIGVDKKNNDWLNLHCGLVPKVTCANMLIEFMHGMVQLDETGNIIFRNKKLATPKCPNCQIQKEKGD